MYKFVFLFFSIFILLLSNCFFIIEEGEKGLILRFGKILNIENTKDAEYNPGLHWKVPLIDCVKKINVKTQTTDNSFTYFTTKENKNLNINTYIKWKIINLKKYFINTSEGNQYQTKLLINNGLDEKLRALIQSLTMQEIIILLDNNLTNKIENFSDFNFCKQFKKRFNVEKKFFLLDYSYKLIKLNDILVYFKNIEKLGIKILDFRISKISIPHSVLGTTYNKIKLEIQQITQYQQLKALEESNRIKVMADYEVAKTIAASRKKASIIKGEADIEVIKLLFEIFRKDSTLYNFIFSLKAYKHIFHNKKNIIFTNLDNLFF